MRISLTRTRCVSLYPLTASYSISFESDHAEHIYLPQFLPFHFLCALCTLTSQHQAHHSFDLISRNNGVFLSHSAQSNVIRLRRMHSAYRTERLETHGDLGHYHHRRHHRAASSNTHLPMIGRPPNRAHLWGPGVLSNSEMCALLDSPRICNLNIFIQR